MTLLFDLLVYLFFSLRNIPFIYYDLSTDRMFSSNKKKTYLFTTVALLSE